MTRLFGKAIIGIALACTLGGSPAGAQEVTDSSGPLWSSSGRQVQLTGTVICTGCTLEEVRKAHPDIPATRLYVVKTGQGQMVTELTWISNPQWGETLITPHVVQLRADNRLLQKILAKENQSKEIHATGLLSHMGTLYVNEVTLLATCSEEADQRLASRDSVFACSESSQRE